MQGGRISIDIAQRDVLNKLFTRFNQLTQFFQRLQYFRQNIFPMDGGIICYNMIFFDFLMEKSISFNELFAEFFQLFIRYIIGPVIFCIMGSDVLKQILF